VKVKILELDNSEVGTSGCTVDASVTVKTAKWVGFAKKLKEAENEQGSESATNAWHSGCSNYDEGGSAILQ
jgi:hypothetical protein